MIALRLKSFFESYWPFVIAILTIITINLNISPQNSTRTMGWRSGPTKMHARTQRNKSSWIKEIKIPGRDRRGTWPCTDTLLSSPPTRSVSPGGPGRTGGGSSRTPTLYSAASPSPTVERGTPRGGLLLGAPPKPQASKGVHFKINLAIGGSRGGVLVRTLQMLKYCTSIWRTSRGEFPGAVFKINPCINWNGSYCHG